MTQTQDNGTITAEQRLTIVKHLANGRGIDFTAAAMSLRPSTVREIGHEHGWPRPESLAKAADVLARNLDADAKAGITERPDLERAVRAASEPAARPQATPRPQPPAQRTVDTTTDLLHRGRASAKARTRNLADKIARDLSRLRDTIAEEERQAAAKAERDAERQAALDRVREAERALREARAKLRTPAKAKRADAIKTGQPRSGAPKPPSPSALMRQWAAEQGLDCPSRGRVPQHIREAYASAHAKNGAA